VLRGVVGDRPESPLGKDSHRVIRVNPTPQSLYLN
jgi:hypothetical protein